MIHFHNKLVHSRTVYQLSLWIREEKRAFNRFYWVRLFVSVLCNLPKCLLCYWFKFCSIISGSGKSFTMMGTAEAKGLIPRLSDALFEQIASTQDPCISHKVEVSYMEIYNEKVRCHLLKEHRFFSKTPFSNFLFFLHRYTISLIQKDLVRRLRLENIKSLVLTLMVSLSSPFHPMKWVWMAV